MHVGILSDIEAMEALRDPWNALADLFPNPMLRHEWFMAGARAFYPPGTLQIYTVESGGELQAIAPLSARSRLGAQWLEIVGAHALYEPTGFLYRDERSLCELVDVILDAGRPLVLGRLERDSRELATFRASSRRRAISVAAPDSGAPWIPIDRAWDDYMAGLSKSRRAELRRARRRCEELGDPSFEFVSPLVDEAELHVERFAEVEGSSWKLEHGGALLSNPQLLDFFKLYAEAAAEHDMLRFSYLRLDARRIAVLFGVEFARRFWVLKVGYDEAWARCSPGKLLMHETIKAAFESGLEAFEFLGNDEAWLSMWPHEVRPLARSRTYPLTARGVVGIAQDGLAQVAKRVRASVGRTRPYAGSRS